MEVETPVLQPIYGGAAARPFVTHHNTLDMELYMRVAPELYLKRLVIGGFTKVFEIGKVFRNEGISTKHNPEFTMMEAYAAYWDHTNQMRLTEKLFETVALELHGTTSIEYQGREVDLSTPWERKPMDSMVSERLGDEFTVDTALNKLRSVCESFEIEFDNKDRQGKLIQKLYEKLVEDDLWGPIFVTEYPEEISPLARGHRTRPGYTERFEGIVAGKEVCNGFSELNDPRDQYFRFLEQEDSADRDDESMKMDFDYIRALKYGLPPTAGLGIGIDRLVMLMTNAPSIRDVILFPTNRPDGYTTSYENDL
jgi:lysyl-tRNA synthetase class 2